MRFTIIASSILLAQGSCLAAPRVNTAEGFSPVPRSKLEARDSYDCNGSGLCGAISVRDCDQAVNNRLIRNNNVNYGAPGWCQERETADGYMSRLLRHLHPGEIYLCSHGQSDLV
ncbi:hypothetical protein F25303_2571 [Fusarium sp. NRRL 25303]|nr:hypothetical protein F25303_2571 [Fusarium sp. NRRL 25303]